MGRNKIYILTPSIFDEVINLVKNGFTIKESLIKIKFCNAAFYQLMNAEQKLLLKQAKASMSIRGTRCNGTYPSAIEAFPSNFNYEIDNEEIF